MFCRTCLERNDIALLCIEGKRIVNRFLSLEAWLSAFGQTGVGEVFKLAALVTVSKGKAHGYSRIDSLYTLFSETRHEMERVELETVLTNDGAAYGIVAVGRSCE